MEKLKDSAILLALVTSFLYCVGAAKDQGFLDSVNLNTEMMAKDFQLVIFQGFILLVNNWIVPIFALLVVVVVLFYVFTWIYEKIKKSKDQDGNYRESSNNKMPIDQNSYRYLVALITLSSIFIFFAFFIVVYHKEGRAEGDELIAKIKDGNTEQGRLIRVRILNADKKLLFLGCGSNNCAGIDLSINRVYYFPQSSGYSYIYYPEGKEAGS